MRFRATVVVVLAVVGLGGVALFVRPPPSPAVAPSQPAVVANDPIVAPSQPVVVANDPVAPKYTRLSPSEPSGLPATEPYGGFGRDAEAMLPADAEPAIWSNDWREGLTGEQIKMYAEGLVRSGLEDLHLCKPGYTCQTAIRYRIYEQNRSDLPRDMRMQLTLTTRAQQLELYWHLRDGRSKAWFMTGGEWTFVGVLEELPDHEMETILKLVTGSSQL